MTNEIITPKKVEVEQKPQLSQSLIGPLSPEQAKQQMQLYQDFVTALLGPEDYQQIQKTQFKKKSAWRKLAVGFNLSIKVVEEHREDLPSGDIAYHFTCEAINPSGRSVSGTGSCSIYEKAFFNDVKHQWIVEKTKYEIGKYVGKIMLPAKPNSIHNARSTAETRAWNRCVSNMIAAGEVSAEEMNLEVNGNDERLAVDHASPTPSVTNDVPACPQCNGSMWDNRQTKTNPKAPDFRCKNNDCRDEKGYTTSLWKKTASADEPF